MTSEWAVVAAALIGSIASPLGTWLASYWTARREDQSRTRDTCYLAVRIATILEKFAMDCAESISNQKLYEDSEGYAGSQHGVLPQLPTYPDDADWKSLNPKLLARALSLRNELHISDRALNFWEGIERDCVPGECSQQCGKCGYMAWQLAADMRHQYGLPPFDPAWTSWDVAGILKPLHEKALRRVREHTELGDAAETA